MAGELSSDDKKEASAVTVRKNGELSEFSNAVHRLNQSNHSNVSAYAMIGIGLVIGAVAVTSMVMTAGLSAPLVLLAAAPVFSMIAVGVEKVITNKNREQAIVEHAKKVPSHAQRSVPMYADVSSSSATTARITEGKPLAKNRAVVWNENKKTCRDAQANETRPLLPAGTCSVG